MTISAIKSAFEHIAPIKPREIDSANGVKPGGDFGQAFEDAMREIDRLHGEANQKVEDVTLMRDGANAGDAYIALEKADVAFQLMSTIRGKIIRAYEEILRTQV